MNYNGKVLFFSLFKKGKYIVFASLLRLHLTFSNISDVYVTAETYNRPKLSIKMTISYFLYAHSRAVAKSSEVDTNIHFHKVSSLRFTHECYEE